MVSLAGLSPGLHSSFSSISTNLPIGRPKIAVAVVTLTDPTCPFESGCTSTTRAMLQSFLGVRSCTISTRSPFSKFLRGRLHFTLCCRFWTYSFLHLVQKNSKDTAHVSIFYGATNLLAESFPVEQESGWIQILGIACWDSEWRAVDDAFYLRQQGSKGRVVEGVAMFSKQTKLIWQIVSGAPLHHPLDNVISIEVSAKTPLDCVVVQLI